MTNRDIFRQNLIDLMAHTKTKQIDIANYVEVSFQTVSAWVTGRGYPRADTMQKLCQFFGVKQSVLTEPHGQEDDPEQDLLDLFRSLSKTGQGKLFERAFELKRLYPRRTKNGETQAEI